MICREETKLNVPMNIMSSNTGLLIDGLKSSGRRKSESDLGKFVLKCASAASPGNVIISPVGQWILNAIEGNWKVKNNWQSSLYSNLGSLDSKISLGRAKLVDMNDKKCLKLFSSSSTQTTPQEPAKKSGNLNIQGKEGVYPNLQKKCFLLPRIEIFHIHIHPLHLLVMMYPRECFTLNGTVGCSFLCSRWMINWSSM